MNRLQFPLTARSLVSVVLLIALLVSGCAPTQPFYLGDDGSLDHYLGKVTELEAPLDEEPPLSEAAGAREPMTIQDTNFEEPWDLSLEECVHISLQNSKVLRTLGLGASALSGQPGVIAARDPNVILSRPETSRTVYDNAIIESNPNGPAPGTPASQRPLAAAVNPGGVEAALSEFDAQLSSNVFWERTDRAQNRPAGFFFPPIFNQDFATGTVELSKKSAVGTQYFFRNNTTYTLNNTPAAFRPIPSEWFTALEVEARQPLLRGFGPQVNRVPVMIARARSDQDLAQWEADVMSLVGEVEGAYWELYCSYRRLEAAKQGRDATLRIWQIASTELRTGQGDAAGAAQSQSQYFQFRAQVELALNELLRTETRLRYLMGLAPTDGRLIRPIDEPQMAPVQYAWDTVTGDAFTFSPNLRRQKWIIKEREQQLIAARNLLLPQLDAVALYRWLGTGDQLITTDGNNPPFPVAPGQSAWEELLEGNYQEWNFGFQLQMPIGFRRELAGLRHYQLQLARDRARLNEMELELTHVLTGALQNLEASYQQVQSNANRLQAAQRETEVREVRIRAGAGGNVDLNTTLQSEQRKADAIRAYHDSVCAYQRAIALVHLQKGTLLRHHNIHLAEGPWPAKAYWDAEGHARRRTNSIPARYGYTRPGVMSQGEVPAAVEGPVLQHPPGIEVEAVPPGIETLPGNAAPFEPTPAEPLHQGGAEYYEPTSADPVGRSRSADAPLPLDTSQLR